MLKHFLAGSAILIFVLLLSHPADALTGLDRFWQKHICIERFIDPTEIFVIPEIPVGCEVIDCCPGCPGPGPLDWQIRVTGEALESVVLEFENLPMNSVGQFRMDGDAKWDDKGKLVVGKGKTIVRGLSNQDKGRPVVAKPRLKMNTEWLKTASRKQQIRLKELETGDGDIGIQKDAGSIELTIDQMLGSVRVNSYRIKWILDWCPKPALEMDKIDVNNNAGNDQTVIFLDARRSTCVNDEVHRGNNIVPLGNVLESSTCPSEVAVFSDDDAMQLFENVNVWTNALGDVLPADLTPDLLQAPVSVWLVRTGANAAAIADIAQKNWLYNSSNCGIGFNANIQDVSANPAAPPLLTPTNACFANWIANLQGSAFYTAGQLNVYYTNEATTAYNCIADPNISVVGTLANPASLAHEIGHAYTLGHTNSIGTIPTTNVMQGGGVGRTEFTEGQCFRMNVNAGSMLNVNGDRTGSTRNCPDGTSSSPCPALDLDETSN